MTERIRLLMLVVASSLCGCGVAIAQELEEATATTEAAAPTDTAPAAFVEAPPLASVSAPAPSRQRLMVTAGVGAFGRRRTSTSQDGVAGTYRTAELDATPTLSVRYERDLAGAAIVGGSLGYATTGLPPFRGESNEHWLDVSVLVGMHRTWQLGRVGVEPRLVLGAGYSQHIASLAASRSTWPYAMGIARTSPGFEASVLAGLGLRLSDRIGITVETGYAHQRTKMRVPTFVIVGGPNGPLTYVERLGQWTTQVSVVIHL